MRHVHTEIEDARKEQDILLQQKISEIKELREV